MVEGNSFSLVLLSVVKIFFFWGWPCSSSLHLVLGGWKADLFGKSGNSWSCSVQHGPGFCSPVWELPSGLCSPRSGVPLHAFLVLDLMSSSLASCITNKRGILASLCFFMFHFLNVRTQATQREATDWTVLKRAPEGSLRELPCWERLLILLFPAHSMTSPLQLSTRSHPLAHYDDLTYPPPIQRSQDLNFVFLKLFCSVPFQAKKCRVADLGVSWGLKTKSSACLASCLVIRWLICGMQAEAVCTTSGKDTFSI